jgi:hypothetical protein
MESTTKEDSLIVAVIIAVAFTASAAERPLKLAAYAGRVRREEIPATAARPIDP